MKYLLISLLTLFSIVGCGSRGTNHIVVKKQPTLIPVARPKQHSIKKLPPAPPKKEMKLKEVKDTNYSDTYMYPEDGAAAKKDPVVEAPVTTPTSGMTKEACIAIISQEKFDKYTAMFGSEEASIKRCAMIKAMGQ